MGVKNQGEPTRFAFGENWTRFLAVLDERRILQAEESLRKTLEINDLHSRSFLDAGSGSGLFSLAAYRLGASNVTSFDLDAASVGCTLELKRRFASESANWKVERGSVLDEEYLESLGSFDVVYSWGVLHHTGQMWRALENVMRRVHDNGALFISIYNDQGWKSRLWRRLKLLYNRGPSVVRGILVLVAGAYFGARDILGRVKRPRGMSFRHDLVDWLGGYPFEVSDTAAVIAFCEQRGFVLQRLRPIGKGFGTNEFVFVKRGATS